MLPLLACQHLGAAQLTLRVPLEYLAFVLPASHQQRPLLLYAAQVPSFGPVLFKQIAGALCPSEQGCTDL